MPLFSVTALLSCTFFVSIEAIMLLLGKFKESSVDVRIMYGFAALNFVVDVICSVLFQLRSKSAIYDSVSQESVHGDQNELHDGSKIDNTDSSVLELRHKKKNLNMLSAFFHVGGDTLRTIAIFSAALVSTITGANPDLCDAWAALAVSVTIVGLAVPMTWEIFKHAASFASDRTVNQLEMISTHAPF